MVRRYAFTMVELIFAIVVISIAVVSLPVMTQTIDKNTESSIVQEAIFASETVLNESTAKYWDKNSQNDANNTAGLLSRVIRTSLNDCNLTLPNRRVGHINRRCLSDLTVGVSNDAAAPYTIDNMATEWNNNDIILLSPSGAAYKADYTATATITQCTTIGGTGCILFGNISPNPDLKEISLVITDQNTNPIIRVRTYSANIGDVEISKRVLP